VTLFACKPCVRASQPHAAAQRVAGDADVGGRPVQPGEPVLGEQGGDPLPLHAGPDPHAPRTGVDRDLLELADVDEQSVVERPVRVGVVAGRLRRHAKPVRAGVVDGEAHVARVARKRHGGGPQIHGEVEHLPRRVPVGIRRGHDAPVHFSGQHLEGG
jgi:hypothetical protein